MRVKLVVIICVCLLAACTSGGSDSDTPPRPTLKVHVGLFGGPAMPGGGMALSDSPAENVNVTAVGANGQKHRVRTDAAGIATMYLSSGTYTVYSTYCGTRSQHVVLRTGHTSQVQIRCAVP